MASDRVMGSFAGSEQVRPLLERFTDDVRRTLPLLALWAHGSLALGDYQPGRSDLDLVALIAAPVGDASRLTLQQVHEALLGMPLADKLHCSYVVRAELAGTDRDHVTWAHGELFARPVSPVTRRELLAGGLRLYGSAPSDVVPAVTDSELADFIRADLRDFWYPHTDLGELWLADIWVDLGMLTVARASVTLDDGRLITKREALSDLANDGAPADVVRDIYQRRYETSRPMSEQWLARRGVLARTYVRDRIERLLGLP